MDREWRKVVCNGPRYIWLDFHDSHFDRPFMDYIDNRLCAKTWRFHSESKK